MTENKVYLLQKEIYARDGGVIKLDTHIFANYSKVVKKLDNVLKQAKTDKNIKIYKHKNQVSQIEVNNDDFPWTPEKIYRVKELPIE